MSKYIYIVILMFVGVVFANDKQIELPDGIHEAEGPIILIHTMEPFEVIFKNKCMSISQLNKISKKKNLLYAEKTSAYFELYNQCFEGDSVNIIIKFNNGKTVQKEYIILPEIEEERDWGC